MSKEQAYNRNDISQFFKDGKLGQPGLLHFQAAQFVSSELYAKDLCVHVQKGDRAELAALLSSAARGFDPFDCRRPKQIILVTPSGIEAYKKLVAHRAIQKRKQKIKLQPLLIGVEETARNEIPQLNKQARVLISTTVRLIDMIRLGNIELSELEHLILVLPEEVEDSRFDVDMLYLGTKIPSETRILSFQDAGIVFDLGGRKIDSIMSRSEWVDNHAQYRSYITPKQDLLLEEFLFATACDNIVVLTHANDRERLEAKMRRRFEYSPVPHIRFATEGEVIALMKDTDQTELLIIMNLSEEMKSLKFLKLLPLQKHLVEVLFLLPPEQEKQLAHIKESYMAIEKASRPSKDTILEGKVRKLVTELRTQADPDALERCKKIIKQESKFLERSNLLALMVSRYLDEGSKTRKERRPKQQAEATPASAASAKPAAKREKAPHKEKNVPEPGLELQSLYVGVGKQQRVFPKDIIGVFVEHAGISRDEIYNVKVMRSYSFLDVPAAKAEAVVQALADVRVKGRELRVNFTRKK